MKGKIIFVILILLLLVGVVSADACKPVCREIGTRSEGWYDSCTGKLIKYDLCSRCEAVCKEIGTRGEGWYSSCDGSVIWLTTCQERALTTLTPTPTPTPTPTRSVCTDSDGADIYTKGTTTGWDYYKKIIISDSDSCTDYDGGAPKDSGQWVIENQCDEEGRVHTYYYKCPAGYWCEDGRCVLNETTPTTEVVCTDTDGGANIFIKGTATGWDYYKKILISDSDSCTDYDGGSPKDSGKWVVEVQCDEEGRVHTYYYKCPAGYWCEDGRCIFNESLLDCPDYCKDGWHYYAGKFNAETEKCEYSKRFCKYGCDEEGKTCKIPENVSCPDYCSDGIFWKEGSFNEWTLECDYKYKIVCNQGCNDEGTACKESSEGKEEAKPSGESSEASCEEKMRKVIEETCLNQGVDEEVCKERYNNLVEFECKRKGQVEKPSGPVIELTICQSIRNKLISLSERLMESKSEEEKEKISSEISELKKEYEKCIVKPKKTESEKTEVNICEELENLKESYNSLLEKERRIKELISAGKAEKTALEEIQKEKLFLEKRIEKAEAYCKSKGSYQETPCLMLSTMMKVERELNERISLANKEEAEKLRERLKKVEEEIIRLREECARQKLAEEKVNSLVEAEEVYKLKIQRVVEESSGKEMDERLRQVEKEKDELIARLVENLKEVDLRNTGIVKQVRVVGEDVYLDDLKFKGKPIRIEVGEREVYVKPGDEVVIEAGGVAARGKVELLYANETLIAMNSKRPIRILPSEVSEKIGAVKEIRLVDEDVPKYRVSAERVGRLLGLIPISFNVEYEINAENGELLAKNKPWWTILVFGESNPQPSPSPEKPKPQVTVEPLYTPTPSIQPTPQPTPQTTPQSRFGKSEDEDSLRKKIKRLDKRDDIEVEEVENFDEAYKDLNVMRINHSNIDFARIGLYKYLIPKIPEIPTATFKMYNLSKLLPSQTIQFSSSYDSFLNWQKQPLGFGMYISVSPFNDEETGFARILAVANRGGLWETDIAEPGYDLEWKNIGLNTGSPYNIIDAEIDPNNKDHIYVIIPEENSDTSQTSLVLLESYDNGQTWSKVNLGFDFKQAIKKKNSVKPASHKARIEVLDSNHLFLYTYDKENFAYYSEDGGNTWHPSNWFYINSNSDATPVLESNKNSKPDFEDEEKLYFTQSGQYGLIKPVKPLIFKTDNYGKDWYLILNLKQEFPGKKFRSAFAISEDGQTIYIMVLAYGGGSDNKEMHLYISSDGGNTWTTKKLDWARRPQWMVVNPFNPKHVTVFIYMKGPYESTDGGKTWNRMFKDLDVDYYLGKAIYQKVYFFSGDKYIRYDLDKGKADPGYPKKIKDYWDGITFDKIDAVFQKEGGIPKDYSPLPVDIKEVEVLPVSPETFEETALTHPPLLIGSDMGVFILWYHTGDNGKNQLYNLGKQLDNSEVYEIEVDSCGNVYHGLWHESAVMRSNKGIYVYRGSETAGWFLVRWGCLGGTTPMFASSLKSKFGSYITFDADGNLIKKKTGVKIDFKGIPVYFDGSFYYITPSHELKRVRLKSLTDDIPGAQILSTPFKNVDDLKFDEGAVAIFFVKDGRTIVRQNYISSEYYVYAPILDLSDKYTITSFDVYDNNVAFIVKDKNTKEFKIGLFNTQMASEGAINETSLNLTELKGKGFGKPYEIYIDHVCPSRLYLVTTDTNPRCPMHLLVSFDKGKTWQKLSDQMDCNTIWDIDFYVPEKKIYLATHGTGVWFGSVAKLPCFS